MIDLDYLRKMAGSEQADAEAFIELIEAHRAFITPRPIDEYHEDMGPVLWWKFPIDEPPYVGTPNDIGITVEAHTSTRIISQLNQEHDPEPHIERVNLGGWPGYHTHFTPIPMPTEPKP